MNAAQQRAQARRGTIDAVGALMFAEGCWLRPNQLRSDGRPLASHRQKRPCKMTLTESERSNDLVMSKDGMQEN